ncbi:TonB family protein [Flammeovirga sp. SubArs3]|uniref:TonB family protein n=1 Tax=Flammeovirga sp. SubArs3 TaxID=2995316 RepID=UPI00248C29CE|nr:TonB family protein [Flammeovirga sp. SubArs3]
MKNIRIITAFLLSLTFAIASVNANNIDDDKPLFSYKQASPINYESAMSLVTYPKVGKDLAIEGSVKVRVYVNAQGEVEKYTFMKGSDTRLATGVDEAIKALEFEPTLVTNNITGDVEAVPSWVIIPLNFSLEF